MILYCFPEGLFLTLTKLQYGHFSAKGFTPKFSLEFSHHLFSQTNYPPPPIFTHKQGEVRRMADLPIEDR